MALGLLLGARRNGKRQNLYQSRCRRSNDGHADRTCKDRERSLLFFSVFSSGCFCQSVFMAALYRWDRRRASLEIGLSFPIRPRRRRFRKTPPRGQGYHRHEGRGDDSGITVFGQDSCSGGARREMPAWSPAIQRAIVGKTNLTEFALGIGMNEYLRNADNPLDRDRIPGGSSSGSAVAVANGEADVAFGSDTRRFHPRSGSLLRYPGIENNLRTGVPRRRVSPFSETSDTIGPMAKDVPHLVQGNGIAGSGIFGAL